MAAGLQGVLAHPRIWRAREGCARSEDCLETGFQALGRLPGGGWPKAALTEVLYAGEGLGELRMLCPALADLTRAGRWVAWVAPPYIPYAPALQRHGLALSRVLWVKGGQPEEELWAAEQLARNPACGAILYWPKQFSLRRMRRLQLAAEVGDTWAVILRPLRERNAATSASLRIGVMSAGDRTRVRIFKCRGRPPATELSLAAW